MMKKVALSQYFDIVSTHQDDKIRFKLSTMENEEAIPFLGRAGGNNGIVDYVLCKDDQANMINEGKALTIALDGSTGSTFYQHHEYYCGQNIWRLKPKTEYFTRFNPRIALFLVTTIRKGVMDYTYNLGLTKKRLEQNVHIILPLLKDGKNVDVDFIEKEMNKLRNINVLDKMPNERVKIDQTEIGM